MKKTVNKQKEKPMLKKLIAKTKKITKRGAQPQPNTSAHADFAR